MRTLRPVGSDLSNGIPKRKKKIKDGSSSMDEL
jgi:hypothetical protein